MLAQAIHRNSRRHDGPFISLNFSSLNPSGIEAELLGTEENPSLGTRRHMGAFQAACRGTLLINGIQHTALQTQQLLLNVLQNGYYMPMGSSVPLSLDVRMIATTTTDLYSLVLEGRFLDDLFFLLNTFSLNTVPIRQRRDDIPLLLNTFLRDAFKDPSLVMEGVGEKANLKDYHDVSLAEDGSFLVFQFETEGDRSGDDAMLAAVNSEDGTSQLIYEGYANTVMCGNKLLFQVESKSGEPSSPQYDLYSYTPEQGKKLEASGLYNFFPSKDGSVICFTKMDDEWIQDLYMAEDGKEVFLADEMNYADANEDCSIIYGERTVEDLSLIHI